MKKSFLVITVIFTIAALSASAYPPPERGKITLAEFTKREFDFDGKIIEIEITSACSFKQISPDKYKAEVSFCSFQDHEYGTSLIHFLNDEKERALKFFKGLADHTASKSIYVLVENGELTAIGKKYKRSTGVYSW